MGFPLQNLTVLITGGAGFIGSHVAETFINAGCFVVAYDKKPIEDVKIPAHIVTNSKFKYINGNILDLKKLQSIMRTHAVDMVSHQAALINMTESIEKPFEYFETNVTGTLNVFEAARREGIRNIVYASSAAVQDLLAPYAFTKLANENLAEIYNKVYNCSYIGLRYFNVYGPRQAMTGAVIPSFINKLNKNQRLTIKGDGEQSRDFVFVEDVARANYIALHYSCLNHEPKVFEIGTGFPIKINKIVQILQNALNKKINIEYIPSSIFDIKESFSKNLNITMNELKWEPNVYIDKGLYITAESYKQG